ncbi:hypothetical protein [Streptomyces sp. NPDC006012]|uniref:hypothetical protein n=1 Tax=Streptomyces sp. NPDC006012 TaxID=3364739 RepID=UPI00369D054E
MPHEKAELIEVVRIAGPAPHCGTEVLAGDDVALWGAAQVDRVLALIGDIPGSELYRCFFPGWGIRVRGATGLLFQLAFCFDCHGVRLWGPDVPAGQEGIHSFDPDSAPARELLRHFRESASGQA